MSTVHRSDLHPTIFSSRVSRSLSFPFPTFPSYRVSLIIRTPVILISRLVIASRWFIEKFPRRLIFSFINIKGVGGKELFYPLKDRVNDTRSNWNNLINDAIFGIFFFFWIKRITKNLLKCGLLIFKHILCYR